MQPSKIKRQLATYNLLKLLTDNEIRGMESYLLESETSIEQLQKSLNERLELLLKKNPADAEEIAIYYEDDITEYEKFFPNFSRKSIFIMAYSFFEDMMKNICYACEHYFVVPKKVVEIAYPGIKSFKDYLIKNAKLDLDNYSDIWQRIGLYQEVHNGIVHNSSKLKNPREEFSQKLKLKVNEKGIVTIEDINFIKTFFSDIHTYLLGAINSFKDR